MADDNKKKYNAGYNSFDYFPDFDSLEKAPVKKQAKASSAQPEKDNNGDSGKIEISAIPEISDTDKVNNTVSFSKDEAAEKPYESIETDGEASAAPARTKKNPLFAVLCAVLSAAIAVTSSFSVYGIVKAAKKPEMNDTDIASEAGNIYTEMAGKFESAEFPAGIQQNLAKLYTVNDDLAGWIYIPGTAVNMPIVQGKNNSRYMTHNYFDSYTTYGTPFADYRCKRGTLSKNTVLFGHDLFVGTHFYDVSRYDDIEWYKKNPVIQYSTLTGNYTFLVYTTFYCTGTTKFNGGYAFDPTYPNLGPVSFREYIKQIDMRALYKTGVDLNADDKIISLVTCTHALDNACGRDIDGRLVVIGRLLRAGENPQVDTSSVKSNPNYLRPLIWYEKTGKKNPYQNTPKWFPSSR